MHFLFHRILTQAISPLRLTMLILICCLFACTNNPSTEQSVAIDADSLIKIRDEVEVAEAKIYEMTLMIEKGDLSKDEKIALLEEREEILAVISGKLANIRSATDTPPKYVGVLETQRDKLQEYLDDYRKELTQAK